jgi:GNAT superfamily N-acetyltransferase
MCTTAFRCAFRDEIGVLIELSHALAIESDRWTDTAKLAAGVRAVFDEPRHNSCYFVATSEDQVVAMLLLSREWNDHENGDNAWIRRVYVREGFRRRGIATALVDRVIRESAGVVEFKFNVYLGNVASRRLFERLGGCFDAANGTLVPASVGRLAIPPAGRDRETGVSR